jgi:hypothetical protein
MSPQSFSDKKVVGLRDTTRNPIHTVVSDSHNLGVANVLEIYSPVPARSSAASAVMERQGCLATAALGAPAVRQHGGGRAPCAPLTQSPGGSRAHSTGGEVKRLCCAAAGIIALAPRPCGAHAHPLTSVRRPAKNPDPLRSVPRPPGESNAEYGLLVKRGRIVPEVFMKHVPMQYFILRQPEPSVRDLLTPGDKELPYQDSYDSFIHIMYAKSSIDLHKFVLGIQKHIPPHGVTLYACQRAKPEVKGLDLRSEIFFVMPLMSPTTVSLFKLGEKLFDFKTDLEPRQRKLMILSHHILSFFFKDELPLPSRYRNGDSYTDKRTDGLHPAGTGIARLYRQHQNPNQGKNNYGAGHRHMPFNALPHPLTEHLSAPLRSFTCKLGGNLWWRPAAREEE